jgi:DNA-binding transcriptional ArsR family regulator
MHIDTAARGLAELGNSTRLQIVRLLVQTGSGGLAIRDLQSRLGVPASTLAFHLRGLVSAGFVAQQRHGRVVQCTPQFKAINETLAFVKEHCCAGLNDLEARASFPPTKTRGRQRRATGHSA